MLWDLTEPMHSSKKWTRSSRRVRCRLFTTRCWLSIVGFSWWRKWMWAEGLSSIYCHSASLLSFWSSGWRQSCLSMRPFERGLHVYDRHTFRSPSIWNWDHTFAFWWMKGSTSSKLFLLAFVQHPLSCLFKSQIGHIKEAFIWFGIWMISQSSMTLRLSYCHLLLQLCQDGDYYQLGGVRVWFMKGWVSRDAAGHHLGEDVSGVVYQPQLFEDVSTPVALEGRLVLCGGDSNKPVPLPVIAGRSSSGGCRREFICLICSHLSFLLQMHLRVILEHIFRIWLLQDGTGTGGPYHCIRDFLKALMSFQKRMMGLDNAGVKGLGYSVSQYNFIPLSFYLWWGPSLLWFILTWTKGQFEAIKFWEKKGHLVMSFKEHQDSTDAEP